MLNLDTHVVVYALAGEATAAEKKLLAKHSWGISAIVLWELEMLFRLKRISMDPQKGAFASVLSRMEVFPITAAVVGRLRDLDFTSDPVDELIAATSLLLGVPLVTRDRKIRGSKCVPIAR